MNVSTEPTLEEDLIQLTLDIYRACGDDRLTRDGLLEGVRHLTRHYNARISSLETQLRLAFMGHWLKATEAEGGVVDPDVVPFGGKRDDSNGERER